MPRLKPRPLVFNLRWPTDDDGELKERLIQAAHTSRRSLNAEILIRLERSFESEKEAAA